MIHMTTLAYQEQLEKYLIFFVKRVYDNIYKQKHAKAKVKKGCIRQWRQV